MSLDRKCPKCGSIKTAIVQENSKHGCLWFLLFGIWYWIWVAIKWVIGLFALILLDWWIALIKKASGKGYVWMSKKLFSGKKRIYHCEDCGHNFYG